MAKRKKSSRSLWLFLFGVYALVMLWLLFDRSQVWVEGLSYGQMIRENVNIVPFYTIDNFMNVIVNHRDWDIYEHCLINLVGNVVMFIPAGCILPRSFPSLQNFFRFLLFCFMGILLIEIIQLLTLLGYFDIDDIILNLFGMFLGYLFQLLFPK